MNLKEKIMKKKRKKIWKTQQHLLKLHAAVRENVSINACLP